LLYDYDNQMAQLAALEDEHAPGHYDLCAAHITRLSVPAGWQLTRTVDIFPVAARTTTELVTLANEVRSIGLRDEMFSPRPLQDNSSIIELRRLGHLRVIADVSRAS
jgi:hypothetical protein